MDLDLNFYDFKNIHLEGLYTLGNWLKGGFFRSFNSLVLCSILVSTCTSSIRTVLYLLQRFKIIVGIFSTHISITSNSSLINGFRLITIGCFFLTAVKVFRGLLPYFNFDYSIDGLLPFICYKNDYNLQIVIVFINVK